MSAARLIPESAERRLHCRFLSFCAAYCEVIMEITQSLLKELLHYDPQTGIFTFRHRDLRHFKSKNSWSRWNNMRSGDVAGGIYNGATGYQCIQIGILQRRLKAHRLAWIYMTGEQPPKQIDHIDGNGLNNAWANLRDGYAVNMTNISMRRDNKSGVSGVSWSKSSQKWQARAWTQAGEKTYKHLGLFESIDDATKAVESFREAEGYSDRHGKDYAHYTGISLHDIG